MKLIDFLFWLWLILFVFFLAFLGYYFYETKEESNLVKHMATQNAKVEAISFNKKNIKNPFLLEGNINKKEVLYATTYYYAMPKEIRKSFEDSDWEIILTDKEINDIYYDGPVKGHLSGLTNSKEKRIYISGKRSDIRRALIHEFGHFFDYQNSFCSFSKEFQAIYNAEKDSLKEKWKIDNHVISNSQEYFAESFSQYILYPERLKKNNPKTYEFLYNLMF